MLKDRVSDKLKAAIIGERNRPAADDFSGWVALYKDLANNLAENPSIMPLIQPSLQPQNTSPVAQANSPAPGGDPMQLDAVRMQPQRRGPLSQEERQRRFDQHLCLYCGKHGHFWADCRARGTTKGQQQSGAGKG